MCNCNNKAIFAKYPFFNLPRGVFIKPVSTVGRATKRVLSALGWFVELNFQSVYLGYLPCNVRVSVFAPPPLSLLCVLHLPVYFFQNFLLVIVFLCFTFSQLDLDLHVGLYIQVKILRVFRFY